MRGIVLGLIGGLFIIWGQAFAQDNSLPTQVVPKESTKVDVRDWGDFKGYFSGQTTSSGAVSVSGGQIEPGEWPHPPHKHKGEEIIHIISGSGTWFLKGEELPAKAGDTVFTKEMDMHTLKNTGDETMHFLVVFLRGKGKDN